MDRVSAKIRSRNMSAVRSSRNKTTELRLVSLLRENKIKGWRRGSKLFGKPDFIFPKKEVAVFVDGCFWHGCKESALPKTNRKFWKQKVERNKIRDRRVSRQLKKEGWTVVRIWEHQLKGNPERIILKIKNLLY